MSLDGNGSPGSGVGAKLGRGLSLQRRAWPVFAGPTVSELTRSDGAVVRAGVHAGVAWQSGRSRDGSGAP